jgi:hypothetical protein
MDDGGVRSADLVQGKRYALRLTDTESNGEPFIKVTYLGPARSRKCRVQYEEGELHGLDEWVPTRQIACPWGEHKSLLRDEERTRALERAGHEIWDSVTDEAVSAVMTASGEYGGFSKRWTTDPASARRYWSRAGLDGSPLDHDPLNFVDRHGHWLLSYATAVHAAQAFAATEPELVDLYLRGWEEHLKAEGFEPGNRHSHDLLREWAPSHALARSWSHRPHGEAAEREVQRLRGLVQTAIRHLRESGHTRDAARLERALHGQ